MVSKNNVYPHYIFMCKNFRAIMHRAYKYYTQKEGYSREKAKELIEELQNEKTKDVYSILRDYIGIKPIY